MKTYELINLGSSILKDSRILSSRIDSEIILSHIMGVPREKLLIPISKMKAESHQTNFNY